MSDTGQVSFIPGGAFGAPATFDPEADQSTHELLGAGGSPSGPAGGALAGAYPNPDLATTGVTPTTYGDATHVVQLTVNDAGQITNAALVAISGAGIDSTAIHSGDSAGGDLTLQYPNPILTSIVAGGTFGDSTHVPVITVDTKGRITGVTLTAISGGSPTGSAGGSLAGTYPNPTLAGRDTSTDAINKDILPSALTVANGLVTYPQTSGSAGGSAGGDLTGTYPNPTIKASVALTGTPTAVTGSTGDSSTQIATDAFVSTAIANAIAGVNPAVATQAATASVLPNSPTYSNGVAGVGATLTAGVTNTALVVDGYSVLLNDRILVKNQASGFQNGVYVLTQISGVGVPWILTRSSDFNSPSDINNTGAIPVLQGLVNQVTQWVVSSHVNTVGTDSISFANFTINPSTILTTSTAAGGSLTGTYPNPTFAGRDSSVDALNKDLLPALIVSPEAGFSQYPIPTPGSNPTGTAGGSLAGTYPNPTFPGRDPSIDAVNKDLLPSTLTTFPGVHRISSGWLPGTAYGDSANVPVITVDANGQLVSLTTATISLAGSAGGSLTGSYPNPTFAGRDASVDAINKDILPSNLLAPVPGIFNVAPANFGAGNIFAANSSYGSSLDIPIITVDTQGRVINLETTTVSLTFSGALTDSYPNIVFAGRDGSVDDLNKDMTQTFLTMGA